MKINYDKCHLVNINLDVEASKLLPQIFCCKLCSFSLKYLGPPYIISNSGERTFNLLLIILSKEFVDGGANFLPMKPSWFCFKLVLLAFPCI